MKQLNAGLVPAETIGKGLHAVAKFLDLNDKGNIDNLLWNEVSVVPKVQFSMAYTNKSLFLKFYVAEQYIKADYTQINDPVYKDSCVELFIAFNNDTSYYNLEFNSIGTVQAGFGAGKHDRINLLPDIISAIRSIGVQNIDETETGYPVKWELAVEIPLNVFIHHPDLFLAGTICSGNFYKCGDELPEPHFLSWNLINSPEPNFHQPAFFSEICFI